MGFVMVTQYACWSTGTAALVRRGLCCVCPLWFVGMLYDVTGHYSVSLKARLFGQIYVSYIHYCVILIYVTLTPAKGFRMEAIKKKMQAMKVEKDNLCDRCDVVEQQSKEAHIRQEKAEEEFTELTNKARTLEIDVDKYGEKLAAQVMAEEAKVAQVAAAEAEFNRLNRRVAELEEDLEITEQKYTIAIQKYDRAATEADDSDRMAKVLANRAEEADKLYDEAQKKMQAAEASLEVNGERADVSEYKIIVLEEELKVVANNLKSLEVSEDKANQRESYYKSEI